MKHNLTCILYILITFSIFSEDFDWFIINNKNEILHSIPRAQNVQYFSENLMLVEYKDSFKLLNKNFEEVISKNIILKQYANLSNNRIAFYDEIIDKYGFLNSSAEVVIDTLYDYVEDYVNGYSVVGFGDTSEPPPHLFNLMIIDVNGSNCSLFESDYIYLSDVIRNKGIALINNEYEIIHNTGFKWESMSINNGKYNLLIPAGNYIIYKNNNKYGFMDWEGYVLTEPIFSAIERPLNSSTFTVDINDDFNKIVDVYGNPIESIDGTLRVLCNGNFAVNVINDKVGLYDLWKNKQLIEPVYDSIIGVNEGILLVESDGKLGYISINGYKIGDVIYDRAGNFQGGMAVVGVKSDHPQEINNINN